MAAAESKQVVEIQRIYVKDLSLEVPGAPQIFKEDWQPDVSVELNTDSSKLDSRFYEVVLTIALTAKRQEKTMFAVELQHSGVFHIEGFEEPQMEQILEILCPTIIFPYARQVIADMMGQASFPPLHLAPVNFEMIYQQKKMSTQKK